MRHQVSGNVVSVRAARLVAALSALAPLCLVGCDGAGPPPGPVAGSYAADPEGDTVVVQVPVGGLGITIGRPTDVVPDGAAADGAGRRAPDGYRYVPVSARLEESAQPGVADAVAGAAMLARLEVDLDGRSISVATPYTLEGGRVRRAPTLTWVPMTDDERDDLEVAVDYDGLVQRLGADGKAVSGSAQPFRDARAGRGDVQDCGGEWRTTPGSRVEVGCSMTPTFTPYLPGIGWADDGRTFVVVDLQLNVIDVRVGDRAVAPGALRLSPSIDVGGPVTPDPAIARALTGTGAGLVSRDFYELPAASTPVLQLDSQLWGVVASTSVAIEGP